MVVDPHADDAVLLAEQLPHFGIGADLGAVRPRIEDVGRGEAEGIHGAVGNAHGTDQSRVGRRFEPAGQRGIEDLGADSGRAARLDETGLVLQSVLGKRDEESVGLLDAMRRDPAQNHVFTNTLLGRLLIRDGVARTAVQQSVVAARGTGGDVGAFEQQGADSPERTVSRNTRSGSSPADNNDIVRLVHNYGR